MDSGLTGREQAKLDAEIARQEKQERVAGQQKLVREGQWQKQLKRQQEMLRYQQSESEWLAQVKPAPIFYPTVEEFRDPIAYIRSIQCEGSQHGICKVVPPVLPSVPSGLVLDKTDGNRLTFSTRQQLVEQLTWGNFDTARFWDSGKTYDIKEYERFADDFQRRRFGLAGCLPANLVEADYWRQVSSNDNPTVEYGNDVEGTAFCSPDQQDPLGSSSWNLQILPHVPHSTLRLLRGDAPGVSSPMLYIGMLFATFAWHVEDHYLYSINYQHLGAAKTWYGVPGSHADSFEAVVKKHVYSQAVAAAQQEGKAEDDVAAAVHTALLGKTTMFSPKLLVEAGVHVTRAVQAPGEYVITFPRAYHGGFSNGFCIGEAVNFSIGDWFPFGLEAANRYRRLKRLPVLAHDELLCLEGMALHEQLEQVEGDWQQHPQADLHRILMRCFVQLIREQHLQRAQLLTRGLTHVTHLPFSASMPCCRCKGMIYLAEVLSGDEWTVPLCLACAIASPPASQSPLKIRIQANTAQLETIARSFEQRLRSLPPSAAAGSGTEQGLDQTGLTEEANYGLPEGSLNTGHPCQPFDWSAAPLPSHPEDQQPQSLQDQHQPAGDRQQSAGDKQQSAGDVQQSAGHGEEHQHGRPDLHLYQQPPEDLITCQRDAPDPLAKPVPPKSGKARGVRGPVHGVKGPASRSTPSKGKASSSSVQRGQSTSTADAPYQAAEPEPAHPHRDGHSDGFIHQLSSKLQSKPVMPSRLLSAPSYDQDPPHASMYEAGPGIEQQAEQQGSRRQSKRMPRKRALSEDEGEPEFEPPEDHGWNAPHRNMSQRLASRSGDSSVEPGNVKEEADAYRAYSDRPRGPGKRPTVKWSKLGSDAESPPGKRSKSQVPGVKAANGTYIPPGPMLNSAATRLACLEDIEVCVSPPGAPRRLFRRRVFAPEDNHDERYLTASDVVKGSGFETNTSASNIIDRWTREACSIIVRHNHRNSTDLPMPELPSRAFCAGMASSCYVLKAVDVEMLMLPGVLKDDLRANLQRYVASVWTRSSLRAPELILAVDRRAPSQAPRGPPARPPPAATHSRRKRFAPQAYGHTDDEEEQDDMQARASVPTRRKRSAPSAYNDFETEDGSNDVDDQHQLHGRRPRSAAFTGQMQQGRAARKGPGASGDALNSFRSQSRPPSAPGAFSNSPPHGPRLQRVLRSRGGAGPRSGRSSEPAAGLRVENWGSDQLPSSASQGLDVLAGLAESALTEQQRQQELEDPPAAPAAAAGPFFHPRGHQPYDSSSSQQHQHFRPMHAHGPSPSVKQQPHAASHYPQLADYPASRQQLPQHSLPFQDTQPLARLYGQRSFIPGHYPGQGMSQAPSTTALHQPAIGLARSAVPENIFRPHALRSTALPQHGSAHQQQLSVAALHAKPLVSLSPGSPTSVIQPAGPSSHPSAPSSLDPSPPSSHSAAAASKQTSRTGLAASDEAGARQHTEVETGQRPASVAVASTSLPSIPTATAPAATHAQPNKTMVQSALQLPSYVAAEAGKWPQLGGYAEQLRALRPGSTPDQAGQGTSSESAPAAPAATAPVMSQAHQPAGSFPASVPLPSFLTGKQNAAFPSLDRLTPHHHPQVLQQQQQQQQQQGSQNMDAGRQAGPQVAARPVQEPVIDTQKPSAQATSTTAAASTNAAVDAATKAGGSTGVSTSSDREQPGNSLLQAANLPHQAPSWSVERLGDGQWVCTMHDGAQLTLGQLYYTLQHVGKSLPQDKLQALSMMIDQLTRLGETCPAMPQAVNAQ